MYLQSTRISQHSLQHSSQDSSQLCAFKHAKVIPEQNAENVLTKNTLTLLIFENLPSKIPVHIPRNLSRNIPQNIPRDLPRKIPRDM